MGKKNFVGNKEQGVAYTYFHSGEVKEVQYFLDGLVHGGDTIFYESGEPRYITRFEKGKRNGKAERYSKDGKLEFVTVFVNDSIMSSENLMQMDSVRTK